MGVGLFRQFTDAKQLGEQQWRRNCAGTRVSRQSYRFVWAIVILFLQRDLERPSLNELSEPDDARAALGLLVLS